MKILLGYLLIGVVVTWILDKLQNYLLDQGLLSEDDFISFSIEVTIASILIWPIFVVSAIIALLRYSAEDQDNRPDSFAH